MNGSGLIGVNFYTDMPDETAGAVTKTAVQEVLSLILLLPVFTIG